MACRRSRQAVPASAAVKPGGQAPAPGHDVVNPKIIFEDRRFDPKLVEFHLHAEAMARSVGYTAKLGIDGQLAQLLRLRVAQLNPCSYCLILHDRAAADQGITRERIASLPSWRESTLYSAAEGAALAYCEALTAFDQAGFAAAHDGLAKHFNKAAIAEIAAVIINMNVWTRLKLAQGATPVEVSDSG
jgi:AhpD family alkylhydroperoxidase